MPLPALLAAPAASATTEWISALSTLVLGVLGVAFTAWQWRQTRFRPRFSGRMDPKGEACELRVVNRGRAAGVVLSVAVVRWVESELRVVQSVFEEKTAEEAEARYTHGAWTIPPFSVMRLILEAPESEGFEEDDLIRVDWGEGSFSLVECERAGGGLSGLPSAIPPQQ